MTTSEANRTRAGVLCALGAHGIWGVVPIYFRWLDEVPPLELLCHRVSWSLVFIAIIVAFVGRWGDFFRAWSSRKVVATLATTSILISFNWFVFLWAVTNDRVLDTSLGYFIMPLTNVVLGVAVLRERLRPWQGVSVALASAGVAYLTFGLGQIPWVSLSLAVSFAIYGLLRKTVSVDSLIGLAVETSILAPLGVAYLTYAGAMNSFASAPASTTNLLLALSGLVTAVPLLFFAGAARRLRLSTLGVVQYLTPTTSFFLAVFLFGEPFSIQKLIAFTLIWTSIVVYTVDSWRSTREKVVVAPEIEAAPDVPVSAPVALDLAAVKEPQSARV